MYDLNVISLGRSNTYEFKFKGKKIVLKPANPSVGNNKERTITKITDKTYLVIRTHFSPESPIDGSTLRSRNSLGLLPLPLSILPIATVESCAPHLYKLHEHKTGQMTISNCNYQSAAESQKWL